ncbi:MAG: hypothetical protein IJ912_07520 [Fibrobacter sp.]|nr:hypothetical protein [Fibrobacter sp.]
MELRPFFNGYAPSNASIVTHQKSVKSERDWDSEMQFSAGLEMNFAAEFSPIRYGFGVGYKSPLEEDDTKIVPASIPVWGTFAFGRINTDAIFSPYAVGRVGVLPLITGNGNWWERPFDFFVAGGLGVILPYRIGVEVNYEYASVLKSYESSDLNHRISTGKFGARLSIGFELSRDKIYNPHDRIEKRDESAVQEEPFDDGSDDSESAAISEQIADSTKATEPVQPVEAESPAADSAENKSAEISSEETAEPEPAAVQAKDAKGKKKAPKKSTTKKKASAKTKAKKSKKK